MLMPVPVIVDTAPIACPAGDATIAAEWRRTTARPAPVLCPETGRVGVCNGQLREHIDSLEESELRKNRVGRLQAGELAACRGGDKSAKGAPTS